MKLYNTLTRKIEEFVPWQKDKVGFYTCGPTVYHYAHIGNMRNYIGHDILDRTLRYLGYNVTRVMNITDVRVRKILSEGRLRAVISITIDNMFAVHDIKIVQGDERLFVAMPSRKDENGLFRDIVHPITGEARRLIEDTILDAYSKHLALLEAEEDAASANAHEA